jgi:hypothetical protein
MAAHRNQDSGRQHDRDDAQRPTRYDVSDSRIAGLQLRVKPTGVRWSMRVRRDREQKRYDLGPAVTGDEDVGGLSIDGARARAARVAELARHGHNPATFLAAVATGVSIEIQRKIEAERPKPSWSWEKAKTAFLAEVKRRTERTHIGTIGGSCSPPSWIGSMEGTSTPSPETRWRHRGSRYTLEGRCIGQRRSVAVEGMVMARRRRLDGVAHEAASLEQVSHRGQCFDHFVNTLLVIVKHSDPRLVSARKRL